MNYELNIAGKTYKLPIRTIYVDEQIEKISNLEKEYFSGEKTRIEVVKKMYEFVNEFIPDFLPEFEEVDTNELTEYCVDIINTYILPERKARNEKKLQEVRELLKRPEVKQLLDLANKQ